MVLAAEWLRRSPSPTAAAAAGAGVGLLTGFASNLRSSYLPMYVALVFVTLWAAARLSADRSRLLFRFAAFALAFVVAYGALDRVLIAPRRPSGSDASNYVYHTIAHPLVMSLAVPENPLSRREGIEWNDMAAFAIARRVDPTVTYLGPKYESALYHYYFGLWRNEPRAMIGVYWMKLVATGRGLFLQTADLLPDVALLRRPYLLFADRVNGVEIVLAALAAAIGAVLRLGRAASLLRLAFALVTVSVLAVVLEAASIYPVFFLAYHSLLAFALLAAPPAALQLILDRR